MLPSQQWLFSKTACQRVKLANYEDIVTGIANFPSMTHIVLLGETWNCPRKYSIPLLAGRGDQHENVHSLYQEWQGEVFQPLCLCI